MKRLLRVLEYTGTDEQIENVITRRGVKGSVSYNGLTIREAIMGEVENLLAQATPVEIESSK